ncbi:Putative zinc finger protein [Nosema bombycis CQ1]|uniref:N-alpha-acetyltransferase 40 n=1 Tax=Nosema bombycis (strain CQ1 / CVCC 102059) TaxID=578461 RepID=R0M5N1_NOSB1|nr:Putative zinc finger protein [Nosema bombycis CQ1]|eukprot:EOB13304.1 Putative zinc finger protein [Nosema bombycis CQ1]
MIQIIKPNLNIKKWAIDLVVNNMKIYNKTPFLRYAKSKSINNPENIFLINYVDSSEFSYNAFATVRIINNILYIYEIHVESTARNKGIGSDLIKCIKNHYTNVNQIVLYVHKKNTRGIEFYKRNEFIINNEAKCDHKYHEMVFTMN